MNVAPDPDKEVQTPLNVTVDWKVTFEKFAGLHGNNPIKHGGRLLFPDGWTHSATSYRGPEWAPPDDPVEKAQLILVYWRKRRAFVDAQRRALSDTVEGLTNLVRSKSGPVMHRVRVEDEAGKLVTKVIEFKPEAFTLRLRWLIEDVEACDGYIQQLSESIAALTTDQQQLADDRRRADEAAMEQARVGRALG